MAISKFSIHVYCLSLKSRQHIFQNAFVGFICWLKGRKANGYSGVSLSSMESRTDNAAGLIHGLARLADQLTESMLEPGTSWGSLQGATSSTLFPAHICPFTSSGVLLPQNCPSAPALFPCPVPGPHPSSVPHSPPSASKSFFFLIFEPSVTSPQHTEMGYPPGLLPSS